MKVAFQLTIKLSVLIFSVVAFFVLLNAQSKKDPSPLVASLTASEQALVDGSKKAILATGISEPYFSAHFQLLRVENKLSDRRVTWQFSLNGYETVINDSIGFYTQGGKQVNTHSIARVLGQTSEISRTISRNRALALMKKCIGNFADLSVQYGPVNGRAELLMVATSKRSISARQREEAREREREEKEEIERRSKRTGNDEIESEEGEMKLPPLIFGYINLQTGKCSKGAGMSSPFASLPNQIVDKRFLAVH